MVVDGDWVVGLGGHRCPMTVATWNDLKQLHAGHKDTHAVRNYACYTVTTPFYIFGCTKILFVYRVTKE